MPIVGAKRWSVIEIWEANYSRKTVLVATRKVTERNKIIIKHPNPDKTGAYDGEYFISGTAVRNCPIKSNGKIDCYDVPISKLETLAFNPPPPITEEPPEQPQLFSTDKLIKRREIS